MTGPGIPGGPGGPGCPTPSLPGSPCKRRPRPRPGRWQGQGRPTPPRPGSPPTRGSSPHVSEAPLTGSPLGPARAPWAPLTFSPRVPLSPFGPCRDGNNRLRHRRGASPSLPRDLGRTGPGNRRKPAGGLDPESSHGAQGIPRRRWQEASPAALDGHPPGLRPRPLCPGGRGTPGVRLHRLLPAKDRQGQAVRCRRVGRCREPTGCGCRGSPRPAQPASGSTRGRDRTGPGGCVAPATDAVGPGGAGPRTRGNLGVPWGPRAPNSEEQAQGRSGGRQEDDAAPASWGPTQAHPGGPRGPGPRGPRPSTGSGLSPGATRPRPGL